MKILQIGTGIRGRHWVEIVRDYPDATAVGFVDPDPAALAQARAIAGDVPGFTDLAQALREVQADAAIVVSPSSWHADHAIQLLETGLSVMVEKPFALTVTDASRVLARAEALKRPLMIAENYRFWPSERTVRKLIADGAIGRIDSATLIDRRHMPSRTEGPWLAKIEYPQLQEVAIHHFDSLRYFFDRKPTSIAVRAWKAPWSDYSHGANTDALLDFEGIRVQYLGTMNSHRFSFGLWVEGEEGEIWTNRKYVFHRRAGSRFFKPVRVVKGAPGDGAKYPRGGTTSLLNGLRDAVRHGTMPETNGRDNIWNVAMVEAGKLSDREGRTVPISEFYAG